MKLILIIVVLGWSFTSTSQLKKTYGFDIGNANTEGLNVGVEFMNRLVWGRYDELIKLVIDCNLSDTSGLANRCKKINEEYGKVPASVCFYKREPGSIWYERTYFSKDQEIIEYLLQILVIFKMSDKGLEIDEIIYKTGDEIIHRELEVIERTKKVDDNNPPPPPPPMGFRK
jgi:hypothetical protein